LIDFRECADFINFSVASAAALSRQYSPGAEWPDTQKGPPVPWRAFLVNLSG
jgi:hypothetical protein